MGFETIYYAADSPKIFTLFSLNRVRTGASKGCTSVQEKAKEYFLVISWPEVRNISNISAGKKPPSDGQRAYLRQFFNHFIPSGFLEAVKQDSRARGADALVK